MGGLNLKLIRCADTDAEVWINLNQIVSIIPATYTVTKEVEELSRKVRQRMETRDIESMKEFGTMFSVPKFENREKDVQREVAEHIVRHSGWCIVTSNPNANFYVDEATKDDIWKCSLQ